ncbi:hypothetical protein ADL22_10550 [Streptomyces sp. NRRL F-4489]|uniref:DUF6333 family protein n=1 Tax=Streptomyces sp. NRRL F-4489 TaxID=1609095 RepID=UPI000749CF8F|nr:DUF6333 family protein [Streptomyces sp. NRRL F-4489]KUL45969.1 hypothetical protein ADL22_10550 [Streptomyces sp. NRRL F-4489]
MNEISFWSCPPDKPVRGSVSDEYHITLLDPPLPGSTTPLPSHDPGRARAFAEAFPTVDAVLEELPPRSASDTLAVDIRSDLDLIAIGCWGHVTWISDPALAAYDAGMTPVLDEVTALHERYPRALIVGSAAPDFGETHTEDVIRLPDGRTLFASGFPAYEDPWHVEGDPEAILEALGIDQADLTEQDREDLRLGEEPHLTNWGMLGGLVLEHCGRGFRSGLEMSVFRVRHTEHYTAAMEEMWTWAP